MKTAVTALIILCLGSAAAASAAADEEQARARLQLAVERALAEVDKGLIVQFQLNGGDEFATKRCKPASASARRPTGALAVAPVGSQQADVDSRCARTQSRAPSKRPRR